MRAEAWDASLLSMPEHQCKPHPSTYGFRGVGNLRISADVDDATQLGPGALESDFVRADGKLARCDRSKALVQDCFGSAPPL